MPWDHVFGKFKAGHLHSGSKHGPIVKNQKQAVAIMFSEKRAAAKGKKEYQSTAHHALKGLHRAKPKEKN